MTKLDIATEQPTSKQQTNGETDSSGKRPFKTAQNPTDVSEFAELRREFKKYFGYKPVGVDNQELRVLVLEERRKREAVKARKEADTPKWEDAVPQRYQR